MNIGQYRKVIYRTIQTFVLFWFSLFAFSQQRLQLQIIPIDSTGKQVLKKEKLIFEAKDSIDALNKLSRFSTTWLNKDYLSIVYDSIRFDSSRVDAFLNLGHKFYFDSISIRGIPPKILNIAGIASDDSVQLNLAYAEYIKIKKKCVEYYEDNGYPFARVELSDISFDQQHLKARLNLVKNAYFVIDSIVIKGNPRISKKYIYHLIRIKRGNPYNQSRIDKVSQILNELNFLKQLRPPEIEFTEGKAGLYLYLKNAPANFFNGLIGLASGNGSNSKLQFTGDVNLLLSNTLRIGEKIEIYWNKYNQESQNLQVGFQLPYLFILPLGLDFNIAIEKFKVDYLNTNFSLSVNYHFSESNTLKAFYSKKNSYLIDTLNMNNAGFNSSMAGFALTFNRTDYRPNPSKGYYIELSSGYGNTTNEGSESRSLVEFRLNGAVYIKTGRLLSIACSNQSAAMIGETDFYQNQLYKIGGINTLRGFDEQSILSSAYSIFSFEPRLLLGRNSSLFLFADLAWYESRQVGAYTSTWPVGFGAGLSIDTKAGVFKLIYALGKQFDNPVKFSSSKIHFGFSARF